MVVLIAGMTRTGSMWLFNVTRELLRSAGITPLPQEVPTDEYDLLRKAVSTPTKKNEAYCLKTHHHINVGLPHVKIICPYRDVRAAMFSFMKFMGANFEQGIEALHEMMATTNYYFKNHKENL